MKLLLIFSLAFLAAITPATAQDSLDLGWPVACTLDTDCWIMNYVDMDPNENVFKDPACGNRGYDGHKGTDIAVESKAAMDRGVAVLAAKDGTISRIRDGEPDRFPTDDDITAVKEEQKECGNAVLIDHGNSLRTLYCHMKNGSITVEPGQKVKAGDKIGEVGLSGLTEFPHVHFGILWETAVMDPYTGRPNTQGCGAAAKQLWDPALNLKYEDFTLYNAGFYNSVPDLNALSRGEQDMDRFEGQESALVFWTTAFGLNQGDEVDIKIIAPDGSIYARQSAKQDKDRGQQFYYIGKKTDTNPLSTGAYSGQTTITRTKEDGTQIQKTISRQLTVTGIEKN